MEKRNKRRTIALIFLLISLILGLFTAAGVSIAFWSKTIEDKEQQSNIELPIKIGPGKPIETSITILNNATSNKKLVPQGFEKPENNEYSDIEVIHEILWSQEKGAGNGSHATLNIEIKDVVIGNNTDNAINSLIKLQYIKKYDIILGQKTDVVVNIGLTEPNDESQFLKIINQPIKYTIVAKVIVK